MPEQPPASAALYRFAPRLTRAERMRAGGALGAGILAALIAGAIGLEGVLPVAVAAALAVVALAAGGVGFALFRRVFESLAEPRAYRDALAAAAAGRREDALASIAKAIEAKPKAFSPWTLRGLLLSEAGDFEGALLAYLEAINRRPDSWIGWSGSGAALLNLGRLPEAVEALGSALSLGATWPVPRYQLGLALFLRGELTGAAEALGEALALGLDAPSIELVARSLRAWALEKTGSVDAARAEQERARPLRSLPEVGAFRDRLRGAKLSPVGKLAAWAVGVDNTDEPPFLKPG